MISVALIATLAGLGGEARAAAYYFTDAGLRGMSRGGAFIAGVDDLSAQYYNPGALVRLGRGQVYANFSLVEQQVDFTRIDRAEDGSVRREFAPVQNEAPWMSIPQVAVGHHFGLPNTYFAFGLHPPFAPRLDYPDDGPQRYALKDSLVWQFYLGPTVAHRVLPWLTIGAGVYWSPVRAEQSLAIMICRDENPQDFETTRCRSDYSTAAATDAADTPEGREDEEARESDVGVAMKMWDKQSFTWNAGVLVEPTKWLRFGASVLPALKVNGTGSLAATFGKQHWLTDAEGGLNVIEGREFSDQDVSVLLTLPWIVRAGVAVNPVEQAEIEFATVWEHWKQTTEVRVTDVNLVIKDNPDTVTSEEDIPVTDDVVLPANYENSFSFRLGGQYAFGDKVTVRAGGFWEESAVPPTTQTVALVDGPKFGYGLGGTFFFKKIFSIEAAMSQTFIAERSITNSISARKEIPIDPVAATVSGEPLEANLIDGAVVGNGLFSSKLTFLSVGATYYFGRSNADRPKGNRKGG